VASRAWLSDQQKRRAARIAREKDLTCPNCGSSEPVPEDEALAHPGGGADIAMRCANCERASEWPLSSPQRRRRLSAYTHCGTARRRPERTADDGEDPRGGYEEQRDITEADKTPTAPTGVADDVA
jgi:hypothetical protein